MNKAHASYIVIFFLLITIGCAVDTTQYPPIPELIFTELESELSKNAEGVDTLFYVGLYFSLIDGDGDIGDVPNVEFDSLIRPPTNCFIDMYYYQDGEYLLDTLLKATEYTIPYIANEGQDKLLKADVKIDIPYSLSSQLIFPYDSIYYAIRVVDRAQNESNVILTDTIAYSR